MNSRQNMSLVQERRTQEHQELSETFKMFDLNNDGRITKEELATVMKKLGKNTSDKDLQSKLMAFYYSLYF